MLTLIKKKKKEEKKNSKPFRFRKFNFNFDFKVLEQNGLRATHVMFKGALDPSSMKDILKKN